MTRLLTLLAAAALTAMTAKADTAPADTTGTVTIVVTPASAADTSRSTTITVTPPAAGAAPAQATTIIVTPPGGTANDAQAVRIVVTAPGNAPSAAPAANTIVIPAASATYTAGTTTATFTPAETPADTTTTATATPAAVAATEGIETPSAAPDQPASATKTTVIKAPTVKIAQPSDNKVHFTWGAEAGGSIDMSGNDMSSVDFQASFGMRWQWIKMLALGAGVDMMVNNSNRSFPIFALFRTDFSRHRRLVFMELRGGLVMDYLDNDYHQPNLFGFGGVGFNLASSKKFVSYLIVGYGYFNRRNHIVDEEVTVYKPLHCVSLKLGITF